MDDPYKLILPLGDLKAKFEFFGWKVQCVDGMQYETVMDAVEDFKYGKKDGRPMAILCDTLKGFGGFSSFMIKHKRECRIEEFKNYYNKLDEP